MASTSPTATASEKVVLRRLLLQPRLTLESLLVSRNSIASLLKILPPQLLVSLQLIASLLRILPPSLLVSFPVIASLLKILPPPLLVSFTPIEFLPKSLEALLVGQSLTKHCPSELRV